MPTAFDNLIWPKAFITSQRQEGWRALATRYDDGGYSGGTLERPALQQLLKDIEDGKVDTIVVYKVDRLTRSLSDFAKIVEALDVRGVSFVSVTQQFNTTTSMGRMGCVSKLKTRLDQEGIKSKERTSAAGNRSGGTSHSRGALYQILNNRIYLGEIPHRGQIHPGQHEAIVPRELWESVQAQLRSDNQGRRNGLEANSPCMLVGMLHDAAGNRFTPSHTSKNGRRYRYYVCQAKGDGRGAASKTARLPAHDIERQVALRLQSFLQSGKDVMDDLGLPEESPTRTQQLMAGAAKQYDHLSSASPGVVQDFVRKIVRRVVVHPDRVEVEIGKLDLLATLAGDRYPSSPKREQDSSEVIRLEIEARVKRCGGEMRLVLPPDPLGQVPSRPAASLLKALARGHEWYTWILAGEALCQRSIAEKLALSERYVGRVLECAFLAPDIVRAILDGCQPSDLTFEKLTRGLPLSWVEQRTQLGFKPLHHGNSQS